MHRGYGVFLFVYGASMALQIQFCLTISVFQTSQKLCFSKLLLNCLGQSIANYYAPTTRAYIVDGLLLIFSSRHHQAESCHFIFSDVLHHLYSVFVHFVSWRGILPFPEFSMGGVGASFFQPSHWILSTPFLHSSFSAILLKFSCTFFFSYVYPPFLVPVFFFQI